MSGDIILQYDDSGYDGTVVDPESISLDSIIDPLVIFFGPKKIGKTLALMRLRFFFGDIGIYRMNPDKEFRTDSGYPRIIQTWEKTISKKIYAPKPTGHVDFMLLDVTKRGIFCKILEADGEYFFNNNDPDKLYHRYLRDLLNSKGPKVWVFFFSLNMFDTNNHWSKYIDKITALLENEIKPKKDSVIILCNQCDKQNSQTHFYDGEPIDEQFKEELYNKPDFSYLTNQLNGKWIKHRFITFCSTGEPTKDKDGKKIIHLSDSYFPQKLWKAIEQGVENRKPIFEIIKKRFEWLIIFIAKLSKYIYKFIDT